MPKTPTFIERPEEDPGRDPAVAAPRIKRIAEWVREFAAGNAPDPAPEIQVTTDLSRLNDAPPEAKEDIDEKRESGEWDDETPYIEEIRDASPAFRFAPEKTGPPRQSHPSYGLWLLEMSSGEVLAVSNSPFHVTNSDQIGEFQCNAGTEDALSDYQDALDGADVGPDLERKIYGAATRFGLVLSEDVELKETPPIHPQTDRFFDSIDRFFENTSPYLRFGQPGIRSWLLYGTYGTGKTTMIHELARRKEGDCAVVFIRDEGALHATAEVAANQSVPTIIVVSEAEMILNDADGEAPSTDSQSVGASQSMLNFLDGTDQPRNEAGTAIVMSTNRPGRIPDRILKRSGRINDRVRVGPIDGEYAAECANFYLPDGAEVSDETIVDCVGGRVGDDIRAVAEHTIHVAIEQGKDLVDEEVFEEATRQIEEEMQEVAEFGGLDDEAHDFSAGEDDAYF